MMRQLGRVSAAIVRYAVEVIVGSFSISFPHPQMFDSPTPETFPSKLRDNRYTEGKLQSWARAIELTAVNEGAGFGCLSKYFLNPRNVQEPLNSTAATFLDVPEQSRERTCD
jgi:hypothetical protein